MNQCWGLGQERRNEIILISSASNTSKKSTLPKAVHTFTVILTKIPMEFLLFCRKRKSHSKIPIESQGTLNGQNLGKEQTGKTHTL